MNHSFGALVQLIVLAALWAGVSQAAQCPPSPGGGNICTANDLEVQSVAVDGPTACTEGEIITVGFRFVIGESANLDQRAASERTSIGFFIGDLGEPAMAGSSCTFSSLSPLEPPLDLLGGAGGYRDLNGDACGDILASDTTVHHVSSDQVLCKDDDGDGQLDLDFLVTWESNKNVQCTDPADETQFFPASSSKCLLNPDFNHDIVVESPPEIELTKTALPASVPEPGGAVVYSVVIYNGSDATDPVQIDSLVDDLYGDLDGQGTCVMPQVIQPGNFYVCLFPQAVSGAAGEVVVDTITAQGADNEGEPVSATDDAQVTIQAGDEPVSSIEVSKFADPDEVFENGQGVTYGVLVQNSGETELQLLALDDDLYGDLHTQGNCMLPQPLPAGGSYSCSFSQHVSGAPGEVVTDTVTANAEGPDGPVMGLDTATVTIKDRASKLLVVKTASPRYLPEPGGNVSYGVFVVNLSLADTVTLDTLTDNLYGDLAGQGNCSLPQVLAPGQLYQCQFQAAVAGLPGEVVPDTITAAGTDDDGAPVSAQGGVHVTIEDLPASYAIDKTASPSFLPPPGGTVTYAVYLTNTSAVDEITITALMDNPGGDLNGQGNCILPATVAPGATFSCSFDGMVNGDDGAIFVDVITASVVDDDGNALPEQQAQAQVILVPPLPGPLATGLTVIKSASPSQLPEPGGNVSFQVTAQNTGAATLTISALVDDVFGDLDGQGNCVTGAVLDPGAILSCQFDGLVSGQPGDTHVDTVTVTADGGLSGMVQATDSATVTITDLPAGLGVTKNANPTQVEEPGGEVTFSVAVSNTSQADSVSLSSLVDNRHGNLDGQGDCALPQVLAPGETYSCNFTATVSGAGNNQEIDTVVANGTDDDGLAVSGQASATVTITTSDVDLRVQKTPMQVIAAPGAEVTFEITVSNNSSALPVNLFGLGDDRFGNLDGQGDCSLPQNLPAGASYTCTFPGVVLGTAPGLHINRVTAVASVGNATSRELRLLTAQDQALVLLLSIGPGPGPVMTVPVPLRSAVGMGVMVLLLMIGAMWRQRRVGSD